MSDREESSESKEDHRLGTINKWDAPDAEWAAEYDWTRSRGPPPWPVPGGWVFKDAEGGGWWQYYGDAGVGEHSDNSIRETFEADDAYADLDEVTDALSDARGEYAYLNMEAANPDEVSLRNLEDEETEWSLEIADRVVFRRVEPDRADLMAAVAKALDAYHRGELDEEIEAIVPASGSKPADVLEQEDIDRRQAENESLGSFGSDGGSET